MVRKVHTHNNFYDFLAVLPFTTPLRMDTLKVSDVFCAIMKKSSITQGNYKLLLSNRMYRNLNQTKQNLHFILKS